MRLGPAQRTIPAKIFVENLNCPDLTASFLDVEGSSAVLEGLGPSSTAIALPFGVVVKSRRVDLYVGD